MNKLELAFFGLCSVIALLGAIVTVGAKNPIRGAMGLLSTIIGIAGLYLMLAAEFLAAIQLLVYAGAVVILFLFVIMLLGPSAQSKRDARGAVARYVGAAAMLVSGLGAMVLVMRTQSGTPTALPAAPPQFGTIESIGHELFSTALVPFELSGALLLVAVIGAVAVARGKQVDPTLLPAADAKPSQAPSPNARTAGQTKEARS
ncbi:NADH-quinone oxidoreductase subunit J family protein [Polyangium mundeleinium]|uniref:NADH-quinone oxidoreductase subunit J n=1 Tax=Polyangium mundeleinium TaxID=2995306 RepID=A0ABT5EXV4_9BACT|nr:NADH-quinone oxidoreductase subunit J [Polyangium mundeleinium]MDC0745752.1 NADH-quinone oxidoreductase subunit J [Polyangium mundeleinium]